MQSGIGYKKLSTFLKYISLPVTISLYIINPQYIIIHIRSSPLPRLNQIIITDKTIHRITTSPTNWIYLLTIYINTIGSHHHFPNLLTSLTQIGIKTSPPLPLLTYQLRSDKHSNAHMDRMGQLAPKSQFESQNQNLNPPCHYPTNSPFEFKPPQNRRKCNTHQDFSKTFHIFVSLHFHSVQILRFQFSVTSPISIGEVFY